jgi:hypothetical protein
MTNPGFMGQQAAQQAAARASSAAQQTAATDYGFTTQAASNAGRRHSNRYHRPHRRGGFFGAIGRLVSLLFTLVFLAVATGVFLMILSQAQPDWYAHLKAWFDHTF